MMTLTATEYDNAYNKALCNFAEVSEQEMTGTLYGMKKAKTAFRAERLWLFIYALSTWENSDDAINYITDSQMMKILAKVQNYGS